MGMHAGEAEQTAAGLVGLGVHRAARIAAVAHGGQVLVSRTAAALGDGALPPGAGLRDLGWHRLKDLGRPEQIFQLCAAGLPAEFAPLRSLGNPALPNNLPAELTAFIGRDWELSQVRALVKSSRLVTLTGAGGAGKTRLGLQVAAGLLDGSGDRGVAGRARRSIRRGSGRGGHRGRAGDTGAAGPARAGGPGRRFGAAGHLDRAGQLRAPDRGVRQGGGDDLAAVPEGAPDRDQPRAAGHRRETIYRVPSLSLPGPGDSGAAAATSCDAVALFAARARDQGAGLALDADTIPLVVSVCRRLDAMPLAIELAAARLRSMSLAELDGRLDQRFRLLTGGSRTALARQQTLRAAVDWSYSLPTTAKQVLLGRLSVFAAGFDLAAAEAVGGPGAVDALEIAGLLGALVDKSLAVADPAGTALRYRLLETIRLFAAEELAGAGPEEAAAARAAHCTHYLAVAETAAPHLAGPQQGSWFGRLEADQANLRRAAGSVTSGTWPAPSWGWRAWTAIWVTGTGRRCCTASRRPCSTRQDSRGNHSTRAPVRKAWTKYARSSVVSRPSGTTPAA
jgi:predicted ATPase